MGYDLLARPRPSMLPLPFQFVIAMVAHAINERMARQLVYLLEDVREDPRRAPWTGVEIGRTTVANILEEAGIEPAPEQTGSNR